jgi:hypothetical protein
MKIQAGKTYRKLKVEEFFKKTTVHIDYILDNPVDGDGNDEFKLVVYRFWSKKHTCWKWSIVPYYVLCLYNGWKYNKQL